MRKDEVDRLRTVSVKPWQSGAVKPWRPGDIKSGMCGNDPFVWPREVETVGEVDKNERDIA